MDSNLNVMLNVTAVAVAVVEATIPPTRTITEVTVCIVKEIISQFTGEILICFCIDVLSFK